MEKVDQFLEELKKFSENILTINDPVKHDKIYEFENKFNLKLPEDYKYLLLKCNGFSLLGDEVYGIYDLNTSFESLESVYLYEHNEVSWPQFDYLVPFSPDGGGNFYCFDTRYISNSSCLIVFWTSNYEYTKDDMPEVVYQSFIDCIQEVFIDWTLETYDYNGEKRTFN